MCHCLSARAGARGRARPGARGGCRSYTPVRLLLIHFEGGGARSSEAHNLGRLPASQPAPPYLRDTVYRATRDERPRRSLQRRPGRGPVSGFRLQLGDPIIILQYAVDPVGRVRGARTGACGREATPRPRGQPPAVPAARVRERLLRRRQPRGRSPCVALGPGGRDHPTYIWAQRPYGVLERQGA